MPAPPVSDLAIRASLLFAVGCGRESAEHSEPVDAELAAEVRRMLADNGRDAAVNDALEAVQAGQAAIAGDPVTISAQRYDRLRAEFLKQHHIEATQGKTLWPVGSRTILKRTGGSWSAALKQAGLGVSSKQTSKQFGASKFTQEQVLAVVREFCRYAAEVGVPTSYLRYVDWRKDQRAEGREDLPAGASIRNTIGSWKAAVEAAD